MKKLLLTALIVLTGCSQPSTPSNTTTGTSLPPWGRGLKQSDGVGQTDSPWAVISGQIYTAP